MCVRKGLTTSYGCFGSRVESEVKGVDERKAGLHWNDKGLPSVQ